MAKNTVYIEVLVDDKGTTKRVAVNAAKVNAELQKTGVSAANADRNLKGAAQTSSSATKNFSKMSQGISGGIVPAYAILASQIFALTAAYRGLLAAADFRILIEGQKALTAATGVGYTSLTKSIQAATEAQLTFSQSAQAAAIGTAAGLGADQLTRLAAASNIISKTLGRDLTDTFNRLVRGITKAEPELLDELGIILRLKDASEVYARAQGKNVKDLTLYERTQAVYNFTLDQADKKFNAISGSAEPAANSVRQLGVAFTEALNKILPFIDSVSGVLASVLTDNIFSAVAAFGTLSFTVLKQMLPSMDSLKASAKETGVTFAASQAKAQASIEKTKLSLLGLTVQYEGASNVIKELNSEVSARGIDPGVTFKRIASEEMVHPASVAKKVKEIAAIEKSMLGMHEDTVVTMAGQFKNMTLLEVRYYKEALLLIDESQATALEKMALRNQIFQEQSALTSKKMAATAAAGLNSVKTVASGVGRFVLGALNIAGWVGFAFIALDGLWEVYKRFSSNDVSKATDKFNKSLKETSKRAKEVTKDLELMKEGAAAAYATGFSESVKYLGNAATSLDPVMVGKQIDNLNNQIASVDAYKSVIIELTKAQADYSKSDIGKKEQQAINTLSVYSGVITGVAADFNELSTVSTGFASSIDILNISTDQSKKAQEGLRVALSTQLVAFSELNPAMWQYTQTLRDLGDVTKPLTSDMLNAAGSVQKTAAEAADAKVSLAAFEEAWVSLRTTLQDSAKLNASESLFVKLSAAQGLWNQTTDKAKETATAAGRAQYDALVVKIDGLKVITKENILLEQNIALQKASLQVSKDLSALVPNSRESVELQNINTQLEYKIQLEENLAAMQLNTVAITSQKIAIASTVELEQDRNKVILEQMNNQQRSLEIQREGLKISSIISPQLKYQKDLFDLQEKSIANEESRISITKELTSLYTDSVDKKQAEINLAKQEEQIDMGKLQREIAFNDESIKLLYNIKAIYSTNLQLVNAIDSILKGYQQQTSELATQKAVAEELLYIKQSTLELELAQAKINDEYDKSIQKLSIIDIYLNTGTGAYLDQAKAQSAVTRQLAESEKSSSTILAINEKNASLNMELKTLNADSNKERINTINGILDTNQNLLDTEKDKLDISNANLEVLKKQADQVDRMKESARGVLGDAITEGFAGAIKGTENSIKTILNNIAQAVFDNMADSLSKILSDKVMDLAGIGPNKSLVLAQQRAAELTKSSIISGGATAAETMKQAIVEGGSITAAKIDSSAQMGATTAAVSQVSAANVSADILAAHIETAINGAPKPKAEPEPLAVSKTKPSSTPVVTITDVKTKQEIPPPTPETPKESKHKDLVSFNQDPKILAEAISQAQNTKPETTPISPPKKFEDKNFFEKTISRFMSIFNPAEKESAKKEVETKPLVLDTKAAEASLSKIVFPPPTMDIKSFTDSISSATDNLGTVFNKEPDWITGLRNDITTPVKIPSIEVLAPKLIKTEPVSVDTKDLEARFNEILNTPLSVDKTALTDISVPAPSWVDTAFKEQPDWVTKLSNSLDKTIKVQTPKIDNIKVDAKEAEANLSKIVIPPVSVDKSTTKTLDDVSKSIISMSDTTSEMSKSLGSLLSPSADWMVEYDRITNKTKDTQIAVVPPLKEPSIKDVKVPTVEKTVPKADTTLKLDSSATAAFSDTSASLKEFSAPTSPWLVSLNNILTPQAAWIVELDRITNRPKELMAPVVEPVQVKVPDVKIDTKPLERAAITFDNVFKEPIKLDDNALKLFSESTSSIKTLTDPKADWIEKLGSIFSSNAAWIVGLSGILLSLTGGGTSQDKKRAFLTGALTVAGTALAGYLSTPKPPAATTATNLPGFYDNGLGLARGGIATGPTLAGEGKLNEAVVPLPDGKSIPVMMQGASNNSTNNVSVNVSIDSNGQQSGQSQASNSNQASAMGRAIAGAVQAEISRQKRAGGLLSPYGAR